MHEDRRAPPPLETLGVRVWRQNQLVAVLMTASKASFRELEVAVFKLAVLAILKRAKDVPELTVTETMVTLRVLHHWRYRLCHVNVERGSTQATAFYERDGVDYGQARDRCC